MAHGMVRVFLLDDHEIVRRGLGYLLGDEPDLVVVGEAGDDQVGRWLGCRRSARTWRCSMSGSPNGDGDGDGVTVRRELRSRLPGLRCLSPGRLRHCPARRPARTGHPGTEEALSTALHDASMAALGQARDEHRPQPRRVSSAGRLRAMAEVQAGRPWLTYDALVAVVDAAAWWLDQNADDLASGLLVTAAGEEAGERAWELLRDTDPPAQSVE